MKNKNKTHKSKIDRLESEFEIAQQLERSLIKSEPKRSKRLLKWVLHLLVFPFKWIWINVRDIKTFIIFGCVCAIIGIEVWLPLLLAFISWGSDFSKWCLGIASTCEIFWLLPATPFIPLCIVITIAIKSIFNKIKNKKSN